MAKCDLMRRKTVIGVLAGLGLAATSGQASAATADRASVAALQIALRAHGVYRGPIDGVSGPLTTSALVSLQQRRGLQPDGVVGPATRRALGTLGRPLLGQRELWVGRRGWDVASLEFRLRTVGLLPAASVDGRFTPTTEAALRRFQARNGLTPDGIAGRGTFRALTRVAPARTSAGTTRPSGRIHVVQPGEGLIAIADRYRLSAPTLVALNGLTLRSVIVPGQRLRLPGGAAAARVTPTIRPGRVHVVEPGEGLIMIARRYGVSPTRLAAANGLTLRSVIVPGQRLSVGAGPVTTAEVHVVEAGESWFGIAQRYHVSPHDLASVNASRLDAVIIPGQRLQLPAGADLTAAPDSPASRDEVRASLDRWSAYWGVDPKLARAVAWMESGFQEHVVSDVGALGVMQLLPETWRWVESALIGYATPRTADGNVQAGVRYLRWQLEHFDGNVDLALAGWYQGARAVREIGLYDDTKQFVSVVKQLYGRV